MADTVVVAEVSQRLAEDLTRYLREKSASLSRVYAFSLWTDDVYGEFGVNIATEDQFDRKRSVPARAGVSAERLSTPAGVRWNSGDWAVVADAFMAPSTTDQLLPVARVLSEAPFGPATEEEYYELVDHWGEIARAIFELFDPLSLLPTVPDAVAYIEFPGMTPVELAASMTRTANAEVLGRVFPHWRRLKELVLTVDSDQMDHLRALIAAVENRDLDFMEARSRVALPTEVIAALDDCGLWWRDLAEWSGHPAPSIHEMGSNVAVEDRLALALAIADRIS